MIDSTRLVRGVFMERRWAVVVLHQSLARILAGDPITGDPLAPPERDRFWADPFPVRDSRGRLWVFVEEMRRWQGRGVIVALRVADGRAVERRTVLESEHHYSFPQAHLTPRGWVATAETCDPAAPVYTFDEPGQPWQPTPRSLPVGIIDPALYIPADAAADADADADAYAEADAEAEADAQPWILTATSPRDEFAGYRQWFGVDGHRWREQPGLRFTDDVRARPAGNADGARGVRSVQDCSDNYGVAVSVLRWDPLTRGPGETLVRLDGSELDPAALGAHTLSWTPDGLTVVMDVWRRGLQAASAIHRVLEQRHGRTCAGRSGAVDAD